MITCTAIFDIGKTNKKFILFDEDHQIVEEISVNFEETKDDDGDPCEDLDKLTQWILATWQRALEDQSFNIKALNFTTYGASFVYLNEKDEPIAPLYNYLKPYPEDLLQKFYNKYGDKLDIATETASPAIAMLNSGLQIYLIKNNKPEIFKRIKTALHFPQYLSFLFTRKKVTEFTSIGCHTILWDFTKKEYHRWVKEEGLENIFAPIVTESEVAKTKFRDKMIPVGTGLHDSSAALIPYLSRFKDPFLLLSTGTWGITLNPFAQKNLTKDELQKDCLNYMTFEGKPVKAARLFTGNEHENQTKILADHFHQSKDYYKMISYDKEIIDRLSSEKINLASSFVTDIKSYDKALLSFNPRDFKTYEEAYHFFMQELVRLQAASIRLASEDSGLHKKLFVDGGFSRNPLFMELLKREFPSLKVEAFELSQGTALGAALLMHA